MSQNDTMDIFLIRHGKSVGNAKNYFVGDVDDPLTDEGRAQVILLKKILEKMQVSIDVVFTSTATRAIQSAEILFPKHKYLQDTRLLEVNAGPLGHAKNVPPVNYKDFINNIFPNGESYADVYARVCEWFSSIKFESQKKIAVVAHGGPLVMLIHHIINASLSHFPLFELSNASLTHLVINTTKKDYFFKFINYVERYTRSG